MTAEWCPECLLTPQAEQLLHRLEARLERKRPAGSGPTMVRRWTGTGRRLPPTDCFSSFPGPSRG